MKLHPLLYLLKHALCRSAVGGRKGAVVTKCAAPDRYFTVAIRAGKTGIDGNLLNSAAEKTPEICGVTIVWSIVTPNMHSAKLITILDILQ
jgi:hypothetical protein